MPAVLDQVDKMFVHNPNALNLTKLQFRVQMLYKFVMDIAKNSLIHN